MDVNQLSDGELKEQLLKHGTVPGPILPTTRTVYEKKLKQLLDQGPPVSQARLNGTGDMEQYSDSEEEGLRENSAPPRRDTTVTNVSNSSIFNNSKTSSEANKPNVECESFSVARLVEQMEQRPEMNQMVTHQKILASRSPNNFNVTADDLLQQGELADKYGSSTPSPLGMSATRRKPIKGAAGRPIKFKYDDIVTHAKLVENAKQTVEQGRSRKMVPVYVQVAVFIIVAFLALVFLTMENNPENPFHPYIEQVEIKHPQ